MSTQLLLDLSKRDLRREFPCPEEISELYPRAFFLSKVLEGMRLFPTLKESTAYFNLEELFGLAATLRQGIHPNNKVYHQRLLAAAEQGVYSLLGHCFEITKPWIQSVKGTLYLGSADGIPQELIESDFRLNPYSPESLETRARALSQSGAIRDLKQEIQNPRALRLIALPDKHRESKVITNTWKYFFYQGREPEHDYQWVECLARAICEDLQTYPTQLLDFQMRSRSYFEDIIDSPPPPQSREDDDPFLENLRNSYLGNHGFYSKLAEQAALESTIEDLED